MQLKEPYRSRMLAWVHALESGEYEQAHRVLEVRAEDRDDSPASHCCLGVATRLAVSAAGGPKLEESRLALYRPEANVYVTEFHEWHGETRNSTAAAMPLSVEAWLTGNHEPLPIKHLVHMNDDQHKTFDEIAAYLRKFYELGKRDDQVLTTHG